MKFGPRFPDIWAPIHLVTGNANPVLDYFEIQNKRATLIQFLITLKSKTIINFKFSIPEAHAQITLKSKTIINFKFTFPKADARPMLRQSLL